MTLVGMLLCAACGDDAGGPAVDTDATGTADGGTTVTPASTTSPPATTADTANTSGSETGDSSAGDDTSGPADVPVIPRADCDTLTELVAALPRFDAATQASMIDEAVHALSYGDHGFPAVQGDTLCVAHVGAPGQTLSVAGDFNAWAPGEYVLDEPVDGFYFAAIELTAPPEGLYKLVGDGDVFFADPLARRFGWDEFGEYSQVDALADRGHHERWPAFDDSVGALSPRTVTVYLPAGALTEADVPVLYMHDGQNLFSPDAFFGGWRVSETLEAAIGDGTLGTMIVVGIDNTPDRFDEYTPVGDVLDGQAVGGRAEEYADFVVDGVLPFIEARYPVATAPQDVATMGSSLGGLVALYIGLRHPDRFGHVASMSGTVDWGTLGASNPTIDAAYVGDPPTGLNVYLDTGGGPGGGCPGGGADNYCGNVRMADGLRALGWTDEADLFYRWESGAPHNEAAWADRLLPALAVWFPGM
jgi:pimeloyl-ACP methyl ester carboxylesterase